MQVSERIHYEASQLGAKAVARMDPLCERHLRDLAYHPVDAEFSSTGIYKQFEQLVRAHAEDQDIEWADCDGTVRSELRWEVREAFDHGYYNPSETVECVGCLEDGAISIRVTNPDSIAPETVLQDTAKSDDSETGWR